MTILIDIYHRILGIRRSNTGHKKDQADSNVVPPEYSEHPKESSFTHPIVIVDPEPQPPTPAPFRLSDLPPEIQLHVLKYCTNRQLKPPRLVCRWLKTYAEPRLFAKTVIPLHDPFKDSNALAISKHPVLRHHLTTIVVKISSRIPRFDRGCPERCTWHRGDKENWESNVISKMEKERTFGRDEFLDALDAYVGIWRLIRGDVKQGPDGLVLKKVIKKCPRVARVRLIKIKW